MKKVKIEMVVVVEDVALAYWLERVPHFKNYFASKFLHPSDGEKVLELEMKEVKENVSNDCPGDGRRPREKGNEGAQSAAGSAD